MPPPLAVRSHARVTVRAKELALSLVLQTNGSLKTSGDVTRSAANLPVPRQTLHRWKQSAARKIPWRGVISQLNFSGILCVDEYRPKRSLTYDLFASDRRTGKILYLDETSDRYSISGASAEAFFLQLKGFLIVPWAIIADMAGGISKGAREVFPDAVLQYDYYHVMRSVHEKLKAEIRFVWWKLTQEKRMEEATLLWRCQWTLLRNTERWKERDRQQWEELNRIFIGHPFLEIVSFKQELRDVFDKSTCSLEAIQRRDAWIVRWQSLITSSKHLKKIVSLMTCHLFPSMITYLDYPTLPRSTNAENCIRSYRKMEKARYGFGTLEGRQNHLKLYQQKIYLSQKVGQ